MHSRCIRECPPCRARSTPSGFTLIELMVVVAIISILLTLTVPAIKGMMETSQLAQAENLIRSTLLSARSYAMKNRVASGVRFQDDGHMVVVYASNYDQVYSPEGHWNEMVLQMKAVEKRQPERLPDPWRVTTLDIGNMDGYQPSSYWFGPWKSADEWTNVQDAWFVFPLVLFDVRGRMMLGKVKFPSDWYPVSTGSFGKLTGDTLFAYQGNNSPIEGPHVTTSLRLFNYFEFRACELLDDALIGMSATATDCLIDVNTGMIIRRRADMDTRLN